MKGIRARMEKIDLTFGIPMYNCEKYINELLNCFIETDEINYEILIINDGSTDKSLETALNKKLKNLRIISKENGGVSSARNMIIKKAKGKWITFIDGDDLIDFKKYVHVFNKINNTQADFAICINNLKDYKYISKNKNVNSYIIEKSIINPPWQKFYKTERLRENNILFDKKISLGEDQLFNMEYLYNSKKIKFFYIDLYKYRNINEESLSSKFRNDRFENLMYVNKKSLQFTKNIKEKKALEYIKILNCRACIYEMIRNKDKFNMFKRNYKYIEKIKKYTRIKYLFLNGIKSTAKYYVWNIIPSFILCYYVLIRQNLMYAFRKKFERN